MMKMKKWLMKMKVEVSYLGHFPRIHFMFMAEPVASPWPDLPIGLDDLVRS